MPAHLIVIIVMYLVGVYTKSRSVHKCLHTWLSVDVSGPNPRFLLLDTDLFGAALSLASTGDTGAIEVLIDWLIDCHCTLHHICCGVCFLGILKGSTTFMVYSTASTSKPPNSCLATICSFLLPHFSPSLWNPCNVAEELITHKLHLILWTIPECRACPGVDPDLAL